MENAECNKCTSKYMKEENSLQTDERWELNIFIWGMKDKCLKSFY